MKINMDDKKCFCHDCKKEIIIKNKNIENGVMLVYRTDDKKINIFKCNQCYKENPGLKNYQECEVYSRIVGYLRPVGQWNEGKQKEYQQRKEYKLTNSKTVD